jgi:hypothetical protein
MTLKEANKEIERIDNELEFWLNKKAFILESTIYPSKPITGERVDGGKREDRYKHLDYAIDEIDPEIEKLYKEKRLYEDYIEKELIRLGKYNEVEQLIIFYKEQTTTEYTWEQISQRVHYSITQCRRIYRKWKKQREID